MWKTVILLLITIVVIPTIAFYFDDPLNELQSDILHRLVIIYLVAALFCFVVSTITDNFSQVDKLWSVMPLIYAWLAAYYSDFDPRISLMAVVVSLWGIRLTYNFSRRGGYSWKFWEGDEDYRWAILRAKPEFQAKWKWICMNLFFISLYQMGLILMFTLPIVKSIGGSQLIWADYLLAILIVVLIILEMIADQQQWVFQNKKYELIRSGQALMEPYKKGFLDAGLWGIVRHPNYASEQGIWLAFYFFSVIATGHWINWSLTGVILLILLFKGSADFSEEISANKYPGYKDYIKRVGRFIPRF